MKQSYEIIIARVMTVVVSVLKNEDVLNAENTTLKANLHKRAVLEVSPRRLSLCHIKDQNSALKVVVHQFSGKFHSSEYFLLIPTA